MPDVNNWSCSVEGTHWMITWVKWTNESKLRSSASRQELITTFPHRLPNPWLSQRSLRVGKQNLIIASLMNISNNISLYRTVVMRSLLRFSPFPIIWLLKDEFQHFFLQPIWTARCQIYYKSLRIQIGSSFWIRIPRSCTFLFAIRLPSETPDWP